MAINIKSVSTDETVCCSVLMHLPFWPVGVTKRKRRIERFSGTVEEERPKPGGRGEETY